MSSTRYGEYDGSRRYMVVFVDEYNNWYLIGFFDSLADAEPGLNAMLESYQDEETGEQLVFGDGTCLGHLEEYPSTLGMCFDRSLSVPEGTIEVRGFVL